MNIKLRKIKKEVGAKTLVVYVAYKKNKDKNVLLTAGIDASLLSLLKPAFEEGVFLATANQTIIFRNSNRLGAENIVFVGLGCSSSVNLESFRQSSTAANKLIQSKKFSVLLDSAFKHLTSSEKIVQAICEGFILSSYFFGDFKKSSGKKDLLEIDLLCSGAITASLKKSVENAIILSESVCFSRWLGDSPANVMTPDRLSREVQKSSKGTKLKVTVWDKARIKKEKMGGLIGVSLGSDNEPRFISMEYKGAAASKKPVCFVGKAVTFDAGGLSIKLGAGMEQMKYDMCGGANVIGAMLAIAKLKLKINAIAFVPAVENVIGPKATRPGDILTARSGKTVEVLNTDAEGRLILMDALNYACEKKPAAIFDAATLTGAILVSLGNIYTGVFSRNEKLVRKIQKASEVTQEQVWPMPICDFHNKEMQSDCADLRNISKSRGAGSSTAAAFLEEFVDKDIPWAHFDIAGTGWNCDNILNYCPRKGATGVLVRTFVELAKSF